MTPSEKDLYRLGTAVHAAIERAGTTREAFSRKANLNSNTVRGLCAGILSPSLQTLEAASQTLGLGGVCECLARHFDGDDPDGEKTGKDGDV